MDNVFYELFIRMPRQGPGDKESTQKAFEMAGKLPVNPVIIDMGCGTGCAAFDLARISGNRVYALDSYSPFIDKLNKTAGEMRLDHLVTGLTGDMGNPPFPKENFDLIWSEGAIYNLGFANGLSCFMSYLRAGGVIAVTEAVWNKENPPSEIFDFWNSVYPDIKTVEENIIVIKNCGLELIGHFTLSQKAWVENYYIPLENELRNIVAGYGGSMEVKMLEEQMTKEIMMYRKYGEYYGYEFFIMRKPD
ncbi:MAG: class I SAM-dependent methyltransferase [Bacteroidota bacterium]